MCIGIGAYILVERMQSQNGAPEYLLNWSRACLGPSNWQGMLSVCTPICISQENKHRGSNKCDPLSSTHLYFFIYQRWFSSELFLLLRPWTSIETVSRSSPPPPHHAANSAVLIYSRSWYYTFTKQKFCVMVSFRRNQTNNCLSRTRHPAM